MWSTLTNVGDIAVMMPAAVIVSFWLLSQRKWPGACLWPLLFALGCALVLASKLAFVGWGLGCAALDFTGISGHTLLACTVFPMVSYLALGAFKARWRFIGAAVGWLFGGLIGYSRLMVHAHSSSEVLSGLGLGLIITLVFVVLDTPPQRAARGEWLLFGVLALMMTLQFGVKAPGQDMVTRIALRLSGHSAPYLRGHWRNTHCTL